MSEPEFRRGMEDIERAYEEALSTISAPFQLQALEAQRTAAESALTRQYAGTLLR